MRKDLRFAGHDDMRREWRAWRGRSMRLRGRRCAAMRPIVRKDFLPFQRYTLRGRGVPPAAGKYAWLYTCDVKSIAFLSAILAAALLAGCHSSSKPAASSSSDVSSTYTTYKLRGKVVGMNSATGELTVANETIPGFMDPMTMPYNVKDPAVLNDLHPGDMITADLMVSKRDESNMYLDHIVVVAQAKPDYSPTVVYHVPAPGDSVPDFALLNQDGRRIHLDQFHGKQILITFIYTRCPLPNFCPLVTHNFAILNQRIATDPELSGNTQLLSVSFDPGEDTPARLRAYGEEYIGSDAKNAFAHWDFAVPNKDVLHAMAQYFDVGLTQEADGTITHTLSTTLIGADGKVEGFYPGNDWTVDQIFADLKQDAKRS
jgi:protein SCO1